MSEQEPVKPKSKKVASWTSSIDVTSTTAIFIMFSIVLMIWIAFACIAVWHFDYHREDAPDIGDSFGWVNSLFAALAFAGLLYAIFLQRKELRETRNEFKKQNRSLVLQRFDNTFFNMLSVHSDIVTNIRNAKSEIVGRSIFVTLLRDFSNNELHNKLEFHEGELHFYRARYNAFLSGKKHLLSGYVQSIITLHRWIHDSTMIAEGRKPQYCDILSSYVTPQEKVFLYYHSILSNDLFEVIPLDDLMRELKIFHYVRRDDLLHKSHDALKDFIRRGYN